MVCDLCKDGEAVIQLTEIEGSGVRLLHLCESALPSAASRRRSARPSRRSTTSCRPFTSRCRAPRASRSHCTFCSATLARFPRDRPAWLRALLRGFRDRACATCCGESMAIRGTSDAAT